MSRPTMNFFSGSLLFAALLFSSLAFATPGVGEWVKYQGTSTSPEYGPMPFDLTMEITNYNSSTQEFEVKQVMNAFGQTQTEVQTHPEKDLPDQALLNYIVSNCAGQGGIPETITVAAGTFQTCRVHQDSADESGEIWVGPVPFGTVKIDSTNKQDGTRMIAEIVSFHF